MSALLLITIVLLVAATMAGVFTMNMNITQRISNGSVALSEAEAGLAEVFYHITRDENVSDTENDQNEPIITWGRDNETIRGTITPGFSPDEAYHIITFDRASSYPHSTNNTHLDRDSGSLGRTVPDGKFHIVSTGYCRGQYRTVECIVERPPFPFGLATSGPIVSRDPIKVVGTSSVEAFAEGEDERPGHILCNSPDGVTISAAPASSGLATEISGFVKSAGKVEIAQPAVVRGGVRSFADVSTLADIEVTNFRNEGQSGVITLLDSQYTQPQQMDVMYFHPGPNLRYTSRVELDQAMLYVEGDLVIDGPVSGEGLIVVDGDVTFNSGTALSGANKMAVLSSGDITVHGNNNFFTGLLYAEGNLNASDITIVGNTIVNSPDPSKGGAELSNVTIVSNEGTGDMTVTVTTSSKAKGGMAGGETPPPIGGMGFDIPPEERPVGHKDQVGGLYGTNPIGYIKENDGDQENHKNAMKSVFFDKAASGGSFPSWGGRPGGLNGDQAALWDQLESIFETAKGINEAVAAYDKQAAKVTGMDDEDEDYAEAKKELDNLERDKNAALAQKASLEAAIESYVDSVYDYVGSYTNSNSTFADGIHELDITREVRFNLNEYLPESEKIKMSFWKVYPRRL